MVAVQLELLLSIVGPVASGGIGHVDGAVVIGSSTVLRSTITVGAGGILPSAAEVDSTVGIA